MNRTSYLNSPVVNGFIVYLSKVINGDSEIDHTYIDRKKNKKFVFSTLYEGFEKYHWNNEGYNANSDKIDLLVDGFTNSNANSDLFYKACLDTLEWGAGNKGLSLYTNNSQWLNKLGTSQNVKANLDEALKVLNSESPCFTEFGEKYRMNAGFTKIYAFMSPDTFIIYDSRVAAALAFLVTKYCVQEGFSNVPLELSFSIADAQGESCRNPSIKEKGYLFSKWGNNQKKHAISNVQANWILYSAFKKVEHSTHFDDIRQIEAALFMIGYDFPQYAKSSNINVNVNPNKYIKKQTKKEQAEALYEQSEDKSRKYILPLFQEVVGLTKAGASTYYQNIRASKENA
ncbi:hypothetical protein [Litorilituus lipolyticus]|uniref:Uncharacterized protein n=1 Tax=Litorilituus lipolyticus TaxID=2491017 RepID=A0A502L065_9GAMM|nr:hypothetical protein [Litorilituus lipolyticus]TPH15865.1 hypothetical protein EPA86_07810 [Litorilituus lipolyticus]